MLILTPNRRLAAFIRSRFNQQQAQANRRSWETPQIYSLDAWLLQLWNLQLDDIKYTTRPILNKIQQQILWEKIIQESDAGVELLRINPTAKNALQAWKFICQWQLRIDKLAAYSEFSIDTAAFYNWLQSYLAWLENNEYIDSYLMVEQIITNIPMLIDKLPKKLCLMGMDDLKPQEVQLFNTLASNNIEIDHDQLVQAGADLKLAAAENVDTELAAAAEWALQHTITNSQHTIGIVVPNLEQIRHKVLRTFTAVIPATQLNISAPLPLANYALIDSALLILKLTKATINFADFSSLLRSPYIQDAETELNSRAQWDRQLRDQAEAKISWDYLAKHASTIDMSIQQLVTNTQHNLKFTAGTHHPQYWAQIFLQLLVSWGWPGERDLTAEEQDLLSCWQALLNSYCQLATVVEDHSYAQATQLLQRLATETPFLPAESGLTRIHVLGVLEGAGLIFDQLWVTSMDRDSWPPDAAPNPFIPLELQRQLDMPRSSPQRELKVARRLTDTLKQGAKQQVIFSYPVKVDDQRCQASNLLADLPIVHINTDKVKDLNYKNIMLDTVTDIQAPALTSYIVKGGANVLKLQAQCPFKANAELRLRAKELKEPQLILSAGERGSIVHEVMEDFWAQTKDQANLKNMMPYDLSSILTAIIGKVLTKLQLQRPFTLTRSYSALEQNRVFNLVSRWLDLEKIREPFTVQQIEQKILVTVGPLSLSLRIDRLDQLADGSTMIIDYKTGNCDIRSWFTDCIVEPQLPLYTLQYDQNLVALVIASMRPDELKFKGVSAEDGEANWTATLNHWRENLSNVAQDFADGNAQVDPYSPQVCRNCKLPALCRLYDC